MAGIDTTNYTSWKQVRTPSGGIYYAVPNSSLVFDPILSQSKGQNVFHPNPQAAIDDRQRAIDAQSPVNQLLPVAGSVAGTVGAGYLLNQIKGAGDAVTALPGSLQTAQTVVDAANTANQAIAPTGLLTSAGDAVNSASGFLNGALGGNVGPVANGAEYAGSISGSAPSSVSGALGSVGGVPVLPVLGGALGAYNLYKGLGDGKKNPLGGAMSGAALGASVGSVVPVIGTAIGAIGGAAIGGLAEMFGTHKKTKQYQQERWGGLSEKGIAGVDVAYQANHPTEGTGTWDTGKYAGEKWTFEKAKDLASSDPTHFQQVYGNFKTFGSDWAGYDDKKQKAIVSALVQNDLYKGDKGDVVIKDEKRAREIKDQVLAGTYGKAPAPEVKTDTTAKDLAKRLDAGRR